MPVPEGGFGFFGFPPREPVPEGGFGFLGFPPREPPGFNFGSSESSSGNLSTWYGSPSNGIGEDSVGFPGQILIWRRSGTSGS